MRIFTKAYVPDSPEGVEAQTKLHSLIDKACALRFYTRQHSHCLTNLPEYEKNEMDLIDIVEDIKTALGILDVNELKNYLKGTQK